MALSTTCPIVSAEKNNFKIEHVWMHVGHALDTCRHSVVLRVVSDMYLTCGHGTKGTSACPECKMVNTLNYMFEN